MAQGNHSNPPGVVNKYEILFVDQEHINHCDLFTSCKVIEPKYIDYDLLRSLSLSNDLNEFL